MARNIVPVGDQPEQLPVPAPSHGALTDYAPMPDEQAQGVQWSRLLAALNRFKWLILLVTLVGTGIGVVLTHFLKPLYTVPATIWIEPQADQKGPYQTDRLLQSTAWVELLSTWTVLDSVVQKERLYLAYEPEDSLLFKDFSLAERFRPGDYTLAVDRNGQRFTLKTREGLVVGTGKPGEPAGARVGFVWTPTAAALKPGDRIKFTVVTPRDASQALTKQLNTQMAQDGNFIRLSLTGTDPVRLTSTMNTLLDQYVAVAADLKRRKLSELSKILAEQVDTVAHQLRDAESRLESYKVQTITKPKEDAPIPFGLQMTQPTVMGNYFGQKLQADELRHDRETIERILVAARGGNLSIDAFAAVPAVQRAPDLKQALTELSALEAERRAALYKYTPEHKIVRDLEDRLQTLRNQTIPAIASQLVSALKTQEADLDKRIAAQSTDLRQIPERAITEQRLTREVQTIQGIFTDLQGRYQAARLAEASAIPDVRILDAAVQPERPSSNSAPRIILLAFLASMGIATGLALLLDRLDKRFRYPDQVTHELGLAIFGAIPAIRKLKGGTQDLEEAAQVVEAFRTIRLNLVHSYGSGPVMLTVSSPGPGDGKSLVSSNLALSFADAGYRTVLVDGDIRRGELHRMFGTDRVPGLLDYLMKTASLEDILRPSSHKNLTVVPCGTRRHHGPELLGSGTMTELIGALKSQFNVIIVDSPPLGAGIDPFVLGTATGNMMLVLRSGETNRQMAEAKLKMLDRLPIRVLGAVLNDIRPGGVYQYYSYVYGYVADELKPGRLAAPVNGTSEES